MAETSIIDKKKIAQNSMYMYFRMIVVMIVQLYTSRVVLANLGLENYGIWNVVASFIIAFTFIKSPIGTSVQRFLNYEMGLENGGNSIKVFNSSILIYGVLSVIFFLVLELAGNWFVINKMQIPPGRESATLFTLQLTILSLITNLFKVPFESLVIAQEKMSFYAVQSIVEIFLKLFNALSLSFFTVDKLELFVCNYWGIDLSLLIITVLYCRKRFPLYQLSSQYDKKIIQRIMSFTGWTLLGALSGICVTQGLNLLLNLFCGVLVNAAIGVASQVNGAVNAFVTNFQTAFKPQIMKGYAANEINELKILINQTSKFSYILLFAITCPFLLNCDYILNLWLKEVPLYTNEMCSLLLLENLLYALSGPMWMTIYATGKLKWYQISIFLIEISTLPLSYWLLIVGMPPYSVIFCKCCVSLFILVDRLYFLKRTIDFSVRQYVYTIMSPIFVCSTISVLAILPINRIFPDGFYKLVITTISFLLLFLSSIYFIALTKTEKIQARRTVNKMISILR